jgi:hypothetical protein
MTAAQLPHTPSTILSERGWRLRLHAGDAPPSIGAAARRAVRAAQAAPGETAVGFALLRPTKGGWSLAAHIWHGTELLREALLLPDTRSPPRRCPSLARSLGAAQDVMLLACEAAAWQRHGGDANAYLAEPFL